MTAVVPPPSLAFHVCGLPVTEGSMRGFVIGRHVNIVPTNEKALKRWRGDVAIVARSAMGPYGAWSTLTGPARVRILFALPRPVSYRPNERRWPISKTADGHGDVDKFARAILDACTEAAVWKDDAQVTDLHVVKEYPGWGVAARVREPGAHVRVWRIDEAETLI